MGKRPHVSSLPKAFYTYHFTTIAKMSASNLLTLKQQIAENNLVETNTRYNFVKVHQSVADSVKLKDSKDLTFSLLFSYNPIFDSGVILSFVLGRKVSEESTYSLSFHNPYNSSLEPSAIKTIGQTSATILTNNNFEYIGYFDLIIRFCFINKIYDLSKVNELLDEYNCKLFNY